MDEDEGSSLPVDHKGIYHCGESENDPDSKKIDRHVVAATSLSHSCADILEQGELPTLKQDSLPWTEPRSCVGGEEEGEEGEGGGEGRGGEEGEGGGGEDHRHLDHASADGRHQTPACPHCSAACRKKEQPTDGNQVSNISLSVSLSYVPSLLISAFRPQATAAAAPSSPRIPGEGGGGGR